MGFSDAQKAALDAKLDRSAVKGRNQGGRTVSYIEGWHTIAEANRIFGFDSWDRETVECKCIAEHERSVGKNGEQGWGVSYIARVKVSVTADGMLVVREGVGAGHGIDRDLGLAHESAIKEAETDAMKRALMTFGNPFGLALYDKTQEGVEASRPVQRQERPAAPPQRAEAESPPAGSADDPAVIRAAMLINIGGVSNARLLDRMTHGPIWREDYQRLPDADKRVVDAAIEERRQQLERAG